MKMICKLWKFVLFSAVMFISKFPHFVSMKTCPECTDVCSDAENVEECTSNVKKCMTVNETTDILCYIEGSGSLKEQLITLQARTSFYIERVKIVIRQGYPLNPKTIQFAVAVGWVKINQLTASILRKSYQSEVDNCDKFRNMAGISKVLTPMPLLRKSLVNQLKISFSFAEGFDGPLSAFFEGVTSIDLTANLFKEIPTKALKGLPLQKLTMSCNKLTILSKESFRDLPNLLYLDFTNNYISKISENSFEDVLNLEVIKLSQNNIVFIPSTLFLLNTKLRVIDLSGNKIENQTRFLDNQSQLESISFENNKITQVTDNFFKSNAKLKLVNFKRNNIQQLPDWILDHGTVNLAHNAIDTIDLPLKLNVKNASDLDMSFNCLRRYTGKREEILQTSTSRRVLDLDCRHCCLDNNITSALVQSISVTADLRYNPVDKLDMEFLRSISHLKTVFLSSEERLKLNLTYSYPIIQDQNKKPYDNPNTIIKISEYSLFPCDFITILRHIKNITQPPKPKSRSEIRFELTGITIGNVRYNDTASTHLDSRMKDNLCQFPFYCPEFCNCYTKGLDPAVIVNCSSKDLKKFPNMSDFNYPVKFYLSKNKISQLPEIGEFDWHIIKELYLENNAVERLENLEVHRNFQTLQMQHNRLKNFSPATKSLLTSPIRPRNVGLSGNSWECTCNATEVKSFMILSQNVVDFENITCKSTVSGKVLYLKNLTRDDVCRPDDSTNSLRVGLSVFVALVLLSSICLLVVHHYRSEIRLWLFTHGYCLRFVVEEEIDADKVYDAFISYSALDEDWVGTHLVPGLENGVPSYTVCVHNRDWLVGEFITEMVYDSLKQSRRTIIVLTDNYVSSEWCRFEFQAACTQAVIDGMNRVLAVVPENVPAGPQVNHELQAFITLKTYLKWDDPYFWRKLQCSMPRVKRCEESFKNEDP